MSTLQTILGGAAAKATGWALIHVLWQASLIAAILGIALFALRDRSANARYVAACIALFATIALPVATGIASFEAMPDKSPLMPVPAAAPVDLDAAPPDVPLRAPTLRERISSLPVEPALPWVVAVWLAGVAVLSMRIAHGLTSVSRMGRFGTSPVPPSVERTMQELAEVMGLSRAVKILRSRRIEVPTVIGWLQPVILVPASALSGLTPHQLRTILAHELAHVRRHDFAVNLVQTAVETLLFFHPAVWWISRQVRVEREHCCDDIAVELCGDPIDYARALATMEELRAGMLPAVAASGGSLGGRIRRLLGVRDDESEAVRPAVAVVAALAVTMAAVLPIFAGSYLYDAVSTSTPGTSIVVLGESDEDLDDLVDSVIDAHLAAADASEIAERIREKQLARVESVRAEVERAQAMALSLKDEQLAEIEVARAVAPRLEAEDFDGYADAVADGVAEAVKAVEEARVAEAWARAMLVAPAAPLAPIPPTPAIAPVAPVAPAFPVPPALPAFSFSLLDGDALPLLMGKGARAQDKPLDLENPSVDDLIFLKRFDIDAKYISEMREAGFENLTARELAYLRSHDVDASTMRAMKGHFGADLSATDVVRLQSVGVDAAFIRELEAVGLEGMTAAELVRLKSMGVDSAYVSSIRGAGYPSVTARELVGLKSMGIDAAWINSMNGARGERFTLRDLIRLKSAGVDAEFMKNWK